MLKTIQSEIIKYKHSFEKKLIYAAPFFFVIYAMIMKYYLPADMKQGWKVIISLVFNWWPLIFIPLGIAIIAGINIKRESKNNALRFLSMHSVSKWKLWVSKVLVMSFYMLLASLIMIGVTICIGLLIAKGQIPVSQIIEAALVIYLSALALIPIHLFISYAGGITYSVGAGIIGCIAGAAIAPSKFWFIFPYSYALRLMCPIVKVHPNGIYLMNGDTLLDNSVIPEGIIISIILFTIFSFAGALFFTKSEVK